MRPTTVFTRLLIVVLAVQLLPVAATAQPYVRPNEALIFSFKTARGKIAYLVRDKQNAYAVYRFGTIKKIEFEYPSPRRPAQTAFKYSFWLRGGGPQNAGIDLNYVAFENRGFRYVVYDTYFAEGEEYRLGVKVTDLKTKKTTDIPGIYSSKKGTLIDLRDLKLMAEGDELFD